VIPITYKYIKQVVVWVFIWVGYNRPATDN
jgi:hypothetical protein